MPEFGFVIKGLAGAALLTLSMVPIWQRWFTKLSWAEIARANALTPAIALLNLLILGVSGVFVLIAIWPLLIGGALINIPYVVEKRRENLAIKARGIIDTLPPDSTVALQVQDEIDVRTAVQRKDFRQMVSIRWPLLAGGIALAMGFWWFAAGSGAAAGITYLWNRKQRSKYSTLLFPSDQDQ